MRSATTTISARLLRSTGKAILVTQTDRDADGVWLPLGLLSVSQEGLDDALTITLPLWLAEEKTLI